MNEQELRTGQRGPPEPHSRNRNGSVMEARLLTSVKDVHEGNGKNVGLLGSSELGNVSVERDSLDAFH